MALTTLAIIQIGLTVASIAYQSSEARKAKKRAAEAADARKGTEITVEGESISLPVLYGRNLVGGVRVYHNTRSSYTFAEAGPNSVIFNSNLGSSRSGSRNEYLFVQQALCNGPINNIIDWQIDNQNSDTEELKYGQRFHIYKNGGVADPMMTANFSERSSSLFTGTSYASMVFRLNRDEPQYSGVPNVSFFVEGKLVRPVLLNSGVYSLGSYTYSNNPALCLLDYLLDSNYGRGLTINDIDLASFYKGSQICGSIVQNSVRVDGRIWSKRDITQRNLPLYECNLIVDTERSVRDNVVSILSTMGDSDLVWSSGKYKLQIQYPANVGLIEVAGEINDNQIVRSSVSVKYPSAMERMNYCTIRFYDEAQDFKQNSASWPPKGSTIFNTLRQQDNNVPLENSFNEEGIVDYYHALAKAEELVRVSRSSVVYTFSVLLLGTFYEPGDILLVNSNIAKITDEFLKITEIKVNDNGTADITAVKFDPNQLAWNAQDNQVVPVRNNYNFTLQPPFSLNLNYYPELATTGGLAFLSWTPPQGIQPANYIVEFRVSGQNNWQSIGVTSDDRIDIFSLKSGQYDFSVRSRSTLGLTSTRTIITNIFVNDGTSVPPSIEITDDIVLSAGKVITNLYIKILNPPIGAFITGYEVQVRKQHDSDWISLGISRDNIREYVNVIDQEVYEVRARVINKVGAASEYTLGSHSVIGKTAPPANVIDFIACDCRDGVRLRWSPIPDVDRDLYEIRTGSSWLDSELVIRTKETEHIIERPLAGLKTYFIKAIDTTGNYSLEETAAFITVNGPSQVVVTSLIIGENYLLQWEEPSSVQQIEEYIITQNETELTRIKSTSFSAKVQWVNTQTFSVIAVDLAGNQSPAASTQITINIAPSTTIKNQVIDNNVLLSWEPVRGTLPTIGYEVRKGNTLLNSQLVGFLNGEFTVIFESASGDFTYWVIPKDSAGNLGVPNNITTRVSQPPDYVLAVDYFSDFSGTRFNVSDAAGEGVLIPFDNSRTWNSQFTGNSWNSIQDAINATYTIYIQPSIVNGYYEEIYDYGTILGAMRVKVVPTIEILAGNPSYQIDISISTNGVDYIDYVNLDQVFGTNFRYVKFRITVNTSSNKDVFYLSKLNLVLDAKQKTESDTINVLAADTGGTTVTFQENFLDITSIMVSANSTTPLFAIYDFVDVPNPTFFKILVFNSSGQRVNAQVSWTARGY